MIRRCAVLCLATLPLFVGCVMEPPKATQEDIDIRNQWAAKVPPEIRDQAVVEANRHPSWGERRRLEFEVTEYQRYLKDQDRKSRLKRPTTKSTTHPTAAAPKEWSPMTAPTPTTSPATTRSTRRSTTRRATTAPASVPSTAPAQ